MYPLAFYRGTQLEEGEGGRFRSVHIGVEKRKLEVTEWRQQTQTTESKEKTRNENTNLRKGRKPGFLLVETQLVEEICYSQTGL